MSLLTVILTILVIFGMILFGWIILAGVFYLYRWMEQKALKKKIPDKIKQEVENERTRREQRRGDTRDNRESGVSETETSSSRISNAGIVKQSESIQPLVSRRDGTVEAEPKENNGRPKQTSRRFKHIA